MFSFVPLKLSVALAAERKDSHQDTRALRHEEFSLCCLCGCALWQEEKGVATKDKPVLVCNENW